MVFRHIGELYTPYRLSRHLSDDLPELFILCFQTGNRIFQVNNFFCHSYSGFYSQRG